MYIQRLARYGNGAVLAVCLLLFVAAPARMSFGGALSLALVAGLAAFNIYVVEKAARLLSEEEWLKAEVRKQELRQRLAAMQRAEAEPERALPPARGRAPD